MKQGQAMAIPTEYWVRADLTEGPFELLEIGPFRTLPEAEECLREDMCHYDVESAEIVIESGPDWIDQWGENSKLNKQEQGQCVAGTTGYTT